MAQRPSHETPEQKVLRLQRVLRQAETTISRLERDLQRIGEKVRDEQDEIQRLELLLEAAYTQLHEHGIEEPAHFPITRKAIALVEHLPPTFTFDEAHEWYLKLEEEAVADLLRQLVASGVLEQNELTFTKTGHKPYF